MGACKFVANFVVFVGAFVVALTYEFNCAWAQVRQPVVIRALIDGDFTNRDKGVFIVHLGYKTKPRQKQFMQLFGDLDQSAGELYSYVIGPLPDLSGHNVTGKVTLAGTLEVRIEPGFQPKAGDRYVLISFGKLEGKFKTTRYPSLPSGLDWKLDYAERDVILSVLKVPQPAKESPTQTAKTAVGTWPCQPYCPPKRRCCRRRRCC